MDNRTIDEIRENENKLIIEIKQLEQANQELKEQLSNSHQIKNKQKEFIEWLENKMKETHYTMFEFQAYQLAFEKFKEIIGKGINVATKKDVK